MTGQNQNRAKKILLVEDDVFVSDLYERVLRQEGFEVEVAADGQAGLQAAKNKPDLVLLDIMLPRINGIDVLKRLKGDRQTTNIPVILLTNLGQENIAAMALKIGAESYLVKMHFSPYDVVDQVKSFFEKQAK